MRTVTTVMEMAGLAALLTAAAATDWRLGLAVAGALLLAVSYVVTSRGAGSGR